MSVKHTLKAGTADSAAKGKSPLSAGSQMEAGCSDAAIHIQDQVGSLPCKQRSQGAKAACIETQVLVVICSTAKAKSCKLGSAWCSRMQGCNPVTRRSSMLLSLKNFLAKSLMMTTWTREAGGFAGNPVPQSPEFGARWSGFASDLMRWPQSPLGGFRTSLQTHLTKRNLQKKGNPTKNIHNVSKQTAAFQAECRGACQCAGAVNAGFCKGGLTKPPSNLAYGLKTECLELQGSETGKPDFSGEAGTRSTLGRHPDERRTHTHDELVLLLALVDKILRRQLRLAWMDAQKLLSWLLESQAGN